MSAATLTRLPERGLLAFTGSERVRWLDGQVTNAVADLEPGGLLRALVLTHQGRIVAEGYVLAREEALWLDLERAAAAPTRAHLERFIISDDVAIADRSDELVHFSLDGSGAEAALGRVWSGAPPRPSTHAEGLLAGSRVTLAAYGFTRAPGFQLFVPAEAAIPVADALRALEGVAEGTPEALECARIEAGTARFGHELDGSVLPAEARLDDAISTTKGCYAGQEVVARMRSRGRVSHLLVGLRFRGRTPAPGARLFQGEGAVGQVTSAVVSGRCGPIGLGYVKAALAEPGTRLDAEGVAAEIVPLPHRAG